ncbi:helicase HerA domain-containing protein [Phytomonospora endophytica]|uniref:Type VI secretion protein n=1 Tax=Phytomonospora endophytica TaxID=714109 RepID=A0A841FUV2_9ACTN|nr:DUF87 domain-containing protein [Phytomonospora endophytica]MBB6038543.1 hypothetical protein [Phytomonospora endophytica]GIG69317.1 hypothetical protein Pen01_56120 [Phytomonospora endophytica]
MTSTGFPDTGGVLAAAVAVAALLAVVARWWARRLATRHCGVGTTLHIQAPPEVDPHSAEAFWRHITGLTVSSWRRLWGGQPHVVFEYAWTGAVFDIRAWVPDTVPAGQVADAIRAAWPAATVTTHTPGTPPLPAEEVLLDAKALRLGTSDASALTCDHDTDPLRPMLGAMTGLHAHEHAVVQILARPAARARIHHLHSRDHHRRGLGIVTAITELFLPARTATTPRGKPGASASPWERTRQRHTSERAAEPMLEVAVRYAVATTRVTDRAAAKTRIRGVEKSLAAAFAVYSSTDPIRHVRQPAAATTLATRIMYRGKLLTTRELAALAHIPLDEALPQLPRAGARLVAPVAAVLRGGRGTKPLGTAAVGGRPIALAAADARHHLHILGSTGTGKSTLLLNLVLGDINAGRGVIVVDPKGDLVADVLARIDRTGLGDRLVVLDPRDPDPPGINPLAGTDSDLVVDHLVGICRKIFERHWGPRADDVLRSALLTIVRYPGATLEALPLMLSSKKARAPYTADLVDDPAGLGGFWSWYDSLAPGLQSQVVGPVLSRIRAMMTRAFVRKTIGAPTTSFDLSRILNGGILLARLPKGELGDDTTRLLGSIIVAKTWQATTARASLPEHRRRDASLYLDEAQNFLTLPRALDEILAEARGYRLSLVVAHQHLAQMPRDMQFAVSANARNKIYFTASPEDARLLAKHTHPHLSEHDLAHLDVYHAAARLVADGRETPAFTLATNPAPPIRPKNRGREVSRGNGGDKTPKILPSPKHHPTPAPTSNENAGQPASGSAP